MVKTSAKEWAGKHSKGARYNLVLHKRAHETTGTTKISREHKRSKDHASSAGGWRSAIGVKIFFL